VTDHEKQSLIEDCLRYIEASRLPTPLPSNQLEYAEWVKKASAARQIDEDAEDAWHELDRLVATEPAIGWTLLTELVSRRADDDACSRIAAGPLTTFLRAHRDAFAMQIEEELMTNAGFRNAWSWWRV
jgi:hypothetical protein